MIDTSRGQSLRALLTSEIFERLPHVNMGIPQFDVSSLSEVGGG